MWSCDECGEVIEVAEAGMVEWLIPEVDSSDEGATGYRIVHRSLRPSGSTTGKHCYYDDDALAGLGFSVEHSLLDSVLGPDGLVYLLEHMTRPRTDLAALATLIQRLHVPNYEAAYRHAELARSAGARELKGTHGFYTQAQLRAILAWRAMAQVG